ncbi:MAG: hypothetical protein JO257_29905 [Deltaproteobacteria bacterium]|nr:hypothetical protein [Deltaproteobacteria bacterium]
MFKKSMIVIALGAGTAAAQGTEPATPAPASPAPMPAGGTDAVFAKGTLGVTFGLNLSAQLGPATLGETVPTIGLMYFLSDKAALRLTGGLNLHKEQTVDNSVPPMAKDTTLFGFALGAGYRMYKPVSVGRVHPYLEPEAHLYWPDTSQSASVLLGVSGQFGVECMLGDWFSLSGGIGAGVDFTNSFKDIKLATTGRLAANLYWR